MQNNDGQVGLLKALKNRWRFGLFFLVAAFAVLFPINPWGAVPLPNPADGNKEKAAPPEKTRQWAKDSYGRDLVVVTLKTNDIFSQETMAEVDFLSKEMAILSVDKTGEFYQKWLKLDGKTQIYNWIETWIPAGFENVRNRVIQKRQKNTEKMDALSSPVKKRAFPVKKIISLTTVFDEYLKNGEKGWNEEKIGELREFALHTPAVVSSGVLTRDGRGVNIIAVLESDPEEDLDKVCAETTIQLKRLLLVLESSGSQSGSETQTSLTGHGPHILEFARAWAWQWPLFVFFSAILLFFIGWILSKSRWLAAWCVAGVLSQIYFTAELNFHAGAFQFDQYQVIWMFFVFSTPVFLSAFFDGYRNAFQKSLKEQPSVLSEYFINHRPKMLVGEFRDKKNALIHETQKRIFMPLGWLCITTFVVILASYAVLNQAVTLRGVLFAAFFPALFFVTIRVAPVFLFAFSIPESRWVRKGINIKGQWAKRSISGMLYWAPGPVALIFILLAAFFMLLAQVRTLNWYPLTLIGASIFFLPVFFAWKSERKKSLEPVKSIESVMLQYFTGSTIVLLFMVLVRVFTGFAGLEIWKKAVTPMADIAVAGWFFAFFVYPSIMILFVKKTKK